MVDKIDKPDVPSPYMVKSPTETKKDKPKEERRQEDLPTFQKKDEALYKEKFQGESAPPKTFRVPLTEVKTFLFVRATPRHGVPMVDAELVWKDGKKLQGVSFLLQNWQDFMRLKNLRAGEEIPQTFWDYGGSHLEITVKSVTTSGPWNIKEIQSEKKEEKGPPLPKPRIPLWAYGLGAAGLLVILLIFIFSF